MLMENDVENDMKLDMNDSTYIGSDNKINDLDENGKFEEAIVDQEFFYTPVSRHVDSSLNDSQNSVFEEAINPEIIDVLEHESDVIEHESDVIESELDGVETDGKIDLDAAMNVTESTEVFEFEFNGPEEDAVNKGVTTVVRDEEVEKLENEHEIFEFELNGPEGDTVNKGVASVVRDEEVEKLENGHEDVVKENTLNGKNNEGLENVLLAACDDMSVATVTEAKNLVDSIIFENGAKESDSVNPVNGDYSCTNHEEIEHVCEVETSKFVTESEEHMNPVISKNSVEKLIKEEPQKSECYSDELGIDAGDDAAEHAVNAQASDIHNISIQPSSDISETDNVIIEKSYASMVEEGIPSLNKTEVDSSSMLKEIFDRESVLVENVGKSSSNKDDESINSTNQASTSPTESANAAVRNTTSICFESKGGPALPSSPAGLGSSATLPELAAQNIQHSRTNNDQTPATVFSTTSAQFGSNDGLNLPSRPAGPGSSVPLFEPASRPIQQTRANGVAPRRQTQVTEEPTNADDESEENDETREKLQMIRVKFLRLTHRLGQTPHNVVVAQVLYRLGLAEHIRRNTNSPAAFSFDRASVMAEQIEAAGIEPLDFSCTILVIGKTGVGKTSTINSIFDEFRNQTDAFQVATKTVQDFRGTVQGIKVRIIDTPGLYTSSSDQWKNEKILRSVKKFISKTPPDIVLYFDRLDMQSRDYSDVPLLKSITNVFGSSLWFNAIIVLTHAASAPPDGPNGTPLSYETFVSQRSNVVQQAIRQAAQDLRLMNPVSLVENHSACRTNGAGQRVLPNGQVWKPHLLLLSFASKILAEANTLLHMQESPSRRRARSPPLPYFLSSLLQSRAPLKLPEEQFGDDFTVDADLDELSDSDDGTDYDDLPPFRSLNKSQLAKLSRLQKKAYYDELNYREKLFVKKHMKEEKLRQKLMKKMAEAVKNLPQINDKENVEDVNGSQGSVPVAMPDLPLPVSFDSDNPSHRYRALDTSSQWIVRPVLENHVWDHDVGYDGLNVERLFAIKNKIPVSVTGQLTKDKKDCTFQLELASSLKHSDAGTTSVGLDMQTLGKDMSYTLRGETRVKNFRRNITTAGVSLTFLGDAMSSGVKVEDNLIVNKRFKVLMSGGATSGKGDVAYGGRLEATLRDRDYPFGRSLSTIAINVVDWHGDTSAVYNMQSQIPIGRGGNLIGNANYNSKGTGQIGLRFNSSDHLQIALLAFLPLFRHIKHTLFSSSEMMD